MRAGTHRRRRRVRALFYAGRGAAAEWNRVAGEYNDSMANAADVLIIGGGVIGLTTAYTLGRAGARVTVLDRQDLGREASWAGAGIISPGNPERAATPYDGLRALSATIYPELSAELREQTGIDNGYRRTGGLEFEDADEPIDLSAWADEGIAWKRLDAAAARAVEPALAPNAGPAYHLPGMAQVRNPRHLRALEAAARGLGVTLRPGCPVVGWDQTSGRITAAVTLEGRQFASHYLVCSGAWSDELLRPLGLRTGVTPVRGQIALLAARTRVPRLILISGKRYVVPRGDGRVLVGSTEEEVGFEKRTTAAAIADLLAFAADLVPSLGDAALEKCWAGLRPGSPDGLPYLGAVPGFENLWLATGHFRSGIQLAPATARVLTEAIQGRPTAISLQPFRPDRSPGPAAPVAFRS
jgi:glycine oxidase